MPNEKSFLSAVGLSQGDRGQRVEDLQKFLHRFGYLSGPPAAEDPYGAVRAAVSAPKATTGSFDEATTVALRRYQEFHQLSITGRLDEATIAQMSMPRCGVLDRPRVTAERSPTLANFVAQGNRWNTQNLTYGFTNFTPDLTQPEVRAAARAAFDLWSRAPHCHSRRCLRPLILIS
jgi:hypothetical protein